MASIHKKTCLSTLWQLRRCMSSSGIHNSNVIQLSKEVHSAIANHQPVVALESTIITHGLPYPHNLQCARDVESIIRENNAVPATVAIMKGKIHVGLNDTDLITLAQDNHDAIKTSRRDIPYVLSQNRTGGTTVSGTMIAANLAGIKVFVTGGIGGVHRGAESSMDISADLQELGQTPVAVISAGVKSILDIGRTLEYLETMGVSVSTFGDSTEFPAFFTRKSGFHSPYNVKSIQEAAQLIKSSLTLQLGSGILIAVPIPSEHEAEGESIELAIKTALGELKDKGVSGKEVTPYILARVLELTDGASLKANLALVKNNASIGAQIACELARLEKLDDSDHNKQMTDYKSVKTYAKENIRDKSPYAEISVKNPIVVGGINMDFTARIASDRIERNGATYPGKVTASLGGVGRNVAECLTRLGYMPSFISAIGNDNYSPIFYDRCKHMDIRKVSMLNGKSTATYCALLQSSGELMFGIGDFDVHTCIDRQLLSQHEEALVNAPIVVMDGNIPSDSMDYLTDICYNNGVPVWFEPTDINHVKKLFESDAYQKLTYISPNLNELRQLHKVLHGRHIKNDRSSIGSYPDSDEEKTINEALPLVCDVLKLVPIILLTLGEHGVLLCLRSSQSISEKLPIRGSSILEDNECFGGVAYHYPARVAGLSPPSIVSVSGAGDCLAAGVLSGILQHHTADTAVKIGIMSSLLSVQSPEAIPSSITPALLNVGNIEPWKSLTPRVIPL